MPSQASPQHDRVMLSLAECVGAWVRYQLNTSEQGAFSPRPLIAECPHPRRDSTVKVNVLANTQWQVVGER